MMKAHCRQKIDQIFVSMGNNLYIAALRRGMSLSIPFFTLGSLALLILNLPIPGYYYWIRSVWDGNLFNMIFGVYQATMGVLSLVLITTVSASFGDIAGGSYGGFYPITAIVCYMLFVLPKDVSTAFEVLTPNWMFTAMFVALVSCALLKTLFRYSKRWRDQHYQEGIDNDFQNVMVSMMPVAVCIFFFIALRVIMLLIFGSNDIQNIGSIFFLNLFKKVGTGFGGSLLFVFLCHALWFFGMHGSNMMFMVSTGLYQANMEKNWEMMSMGLPPIELFTKTFFDSFVLIGGSGATLSLLIALLIGSKKKSNMKRLFKFSILPGIFNINEIVLFGLPVVFNPIMLIPFILVPLVFMITSSGAMLLGLVPYCTVRVGWTTPIFFSGYLATGSISGAILQLINLILGTLIYLPFIKKSDQYYADMLKMNANRLRDTIIEREETGNTTSLYSPSYHHLNDVIKMLTDDLHHCLNSRRISLYYQPQFNVDGSLYGLEALLRWKHSSLGYLYPPMVIELAREEGVLERMGYRIIETACYALERLSKEVNYPIHLAVNITPDQLEDRTFCEKVKKILQKHDFHGCTLCFEVTEQIALSSAPFIHDSIDELRAMGVDFHMDDFGMGHSSIIYLQHNTFTGLKLDGSLVKEIVTNPKVKEIIAGIRQIGQSLNADLIAEYVETEEQREELKKLGCTIYQGYLYSPAIPLDELEGFLLRYNVIKNSICEEFKEEELYL